MALLPETKCVANSPCNESISAELQRSRGQPRNIEPPPRTAKNAGFGTKITPDSAPGCRGDGMWAPVGAGWGNGRNFTARASPRRIFTSGGAGGNRHRKFLSKQPGQPHPRRTGETRYPWWGAEVSTLEIYHSQPAGNIFMSGGGGRNRHGELVRKSPRRNDHL